MLKFFFFYKVVNEHKAEKHKKSHNADAGPQRGWAIGFVNPGAKRRRDNHGHRKGGVEHAEIFAARGVAGAVGDKSNDERETEHFTKSPHDHRERYPGIA